MLKKEVRTLLLFSFILFLTVPVSALTEIIDLKEPFVINVNTGSGTFLGLTDSPANYVGSDGLCLLVNESLGTVFFASCAGAASGDITEVNTNGIYLSGGATSGAVSLLFNETLLNQTIDDRAVAGGLDGNASSICSGTTTYLDGEGNCDDISGVYEPAGITESDISDLTHTSAGNLSWNQTLADTLYASIGVVSNPFNQVLNTTSNVTFNNITVNDILIIGPGTLNVDEIIGTANGLTFTTTSANSDLLALQNTGAGTLGLTSDGDIKTEATFRGNNWQTTGVSSDMGINVIRTDQDSTFNISNSDATFVANLEVDGSALFLGNMTASFLFGDGSQLINLPSGGGDNSSWNQSLAGTLYASISVVDTQKTTNNFYLFNDSSTIFFNDTLLNLTIDNRAGGDNSSWNQTLADTLYASIGATGLFEVSNGYITNSTTSGINTTNLIIQNSFFTPQNHFPWDFQDDGSDLTLDVSVIGGVNKFEIVTSGTFFHMVANPGPANDDIMFMFSETQGADTDINFYEGGTGNNRIWNSGSMRIGGGASSLCSNLTTVVDCDTPLTGADLVVQDDIWAGGEIFSNNTNITNNLVVGNSRTWWNGSCLNTEVGGTLIQSIGCS